LITDIWNWFLNQDYSDDVKIEEKAQSISLSRMDSKFVLKLTLKPEIKIIEEWNTPIGFHEEKITDNRAILNCLNKWYNALKQTEDNTILDIMIQNGFMKVEPIEDLCSVCKKTKDHKKKSKKRIKKPNKVPKEDVVETEVEEDETLKDLVTTTIKEGFKAGEKEKIIWKDLIISYLKKNVLDTKKRHSENIAETLGLDISQANEILAELNEEGIIQKEFEFFDYYILTKDYNSETARKHLEILDYLKQHIDCPSTKCTQFSISLSFDLPFAIVGFILNAMNNNRLISKESIEVPTNGVIRKVACYIPSSY
ncbi:MAG: hypothetical protein ACFFDC_18870, partial [Promethearchaeota archaeon]